jgi:hypothetical protein|tara:strand:- start:1550 stop:1720 length:171 start_codon:yes stop_codon:yes gene_type:complete
MKKTTKMNEEYSTVNELTYSKNNFGDYAEDDTKPKGKKPRKPNWNEQRDRKRGTVE